MKAMSREFTTREKILLVVLTLIILALAYYRFVHVPCQKAIEEAEAQREVYQNDLTIAQAKEKQLLKMKEELDQLGELQNTSRMESYNNSKAELSMLNNTLEPAVDYSIKFESVKKDGDQIRRNFSLSFKTDTFEDAKKIVADLTASPYRCLLGDMQYNQSFFKLKEGEKATVTSNVDGVLMAQRVSVTMTATFFETMYGGTPDAGLPADKK